MILDEVQRLPILLSYIQGMVDSLKQQGQVILTGSLPAGHSHRGAGIPRDPLQGSPYENLLINNEGQLIAVEIKSGATFSTELEVRP